MHVVICYDIFDDKRRNQVVKVLEGYGNRVQYSVFEFHLDAMRLNELKMKLIRLVDAQSDQVRYYELCNKDACDIRVYGKMGLVQDSPFIVL